MSLTTRELPRTEWAKLGWTELAPIQESLPDQAVTVVVERDGEIVAAWTGIPVIQFMAEGISIRSDQRGNPSVGRRLLMAMRHLAGRQGVGAMLTSAGTPEIAAMLDRVQAVKLEDRLYRWPIGGEGVASWD